MGELHDEARSGSPTSPIHHTIEHDDGIPNSASAASGGDRALEVDLRSSMEDRFGGADFGAVRVVPSSLEAPALGAVAFTRGNDIHFAPGRYQPATPEGRGLLAHELTHVLQQRAGQVRASRIEGATALNDDPALELDADHMGRQAALISDRSPRNEPTLESRP